MSLHASVYWRSIEHTVETRGNKQYFVDAEDMHFGSIILSNFKSNLNYFRILTDSAKFQQVFTKYSRRSVRIKIIFISFYTITKIKVISTGNMMH